MTGVQLGYESRCAAPHAFDVLLGSQLGLGAFRALAEEGINIQMISTSEIRVSAVTRADQLEEAVRAVHTAFGLDAAEEAVVYGGTGR